MQVARSTPRGRAARGRGAPAVRAGLLLAVAVAALVLGILGMHALGLHGVSVSHGAPASGVSATAAAEPARVGGAHGADHSTEPAAATADEGHGLPHGAGEMVVLCAAMLAAAAGMLLALAGLRHRAPPVWAELPAAPVRRVTSRARPGGTGPPPVWEFSVIRC